MEVQSESKWKQLGKLAMSIGKVRFPFVLFLLKHRFVFIII